jgi:hypothetical protein
MALMRMLRGADHRQGDGPGERAEVAAQQYPTRIRGTAAVLRRRFRLNWCGLGQYTADRMGQFA